MKLKYVTYEQSRDLKRLGYNRDCDLYYTEGYANDDPEDLTRKIKFHHSFPSNHNRVISGDGPCYSSPTLYEAQDWFREEKKIEINAYWDFIEDKWYGYYNEMYCLGSEEKTEKHYDSFEEALSEAINIAIKKLS